MHTAAATAAAPPPPSCPWTCPRTQNPWPVCEPTRCWADLSAEYPGAPAVKPPSQAEQLERCAPCRTTEQAHLPAQQQQPANTALPSAAKPPVWWQMPEGGHTTIQQPALAALPACPPTHAARLRVTAGCCGPSCTPVCLAMAASPSSLKTNRQDQPSHAFDGGTGARAQPLRHARRAAVCCGSGAPGGFRLRDVRGEPGLQQVGTDHKEKRVCTVQRVVGGSCSGGDAASNTGIPWLRTFTCTRTSTLVVA